MAGPLTALVDLSLRHAPQFNAESLDAGRKPGLKSYEPDELARARRRIKDLETELELVKAASALFNGEEVVRPKGSARSSKD
jgi:hypothetical protein